MPMNAVSLFNQNNPLADSASSTTDKLKEFHYELINTQPQYSLHLAPQRLFTFFKTQKGAR